MTNLERRWRIEHGLDPDPRIDSLQNALRRAEAERDECSEGAMELKAELERLRQQNAVPIAVLAFCPECRMQHIDRGEWETRPHRIHLCEHCGHVWRLAMVPTVGVAALAQATPEVEQGVQKGEAR